MKEIFLRGKYYRRCAMVDDVDFEALSVYKWRGLKAKGDLFYARTYIDGRTVLMHRMLVSGDEIDHRDGNGLNNQRANLFSVSHGENMQNTRRHRAERAYWHSWIIEQLDRAHAR